MVTFTGDDDRRQSYSSRPGRASMPATKSYSSVSTTSNNTDKQSNHERSYDRLVELQNEGKANSTQANLIKRQLAASDAKGDQFNKLLNRPMSYEEKINAAYGGSLPGYMQDYRNDTAPQLDKYGLPAAKLDMDAMKFGDYDMNQNMAKGYGSVFGAVSGSSASSDTVKKAMLEMMGQYYGKYDYTPTEASNAAFSNYFPRIDVYSDSGVPEYAKDPFDKGYGNLMDAAGAIGGIETFKSNFPGHYTMEEIFMNDPGRYGGTYGRGNYYGGGGGGGGGGYGGGGGGGDGESYAGVPARSGMPQGNANEKFGSMAALQQNMINTNAGQNFQQGYARGGLVSLVR